MFHQLSHLLNKSDLHLDVMYPGRIYLSSEINKWSSENGKRYMQFYSYDIILASLLAFKPSSICLWCEAYPPSRSLALYLVEAISANYNNINISLADVCFNCIDEVVETAVYWEYQSAQLAGTEINVFYFDEVPPRLNLLFSRVSVYSILLPLTVSSASVHLSGRITYAVNILNDISEYLICNNTNAASIADIRFDKSRALHMNSLYQNCIDNFDGRISSIDCLAISLRELVRIYMMHESARRFSIMLRLLKHDAIDILSKDFHEMGYHTLPYSLSTHPEYFTHRVLLDPGSHGIASRFTQRSVESLLNSSLPIPLYPISDITSIPYKSIKGICSDGVEIDILAQIHKASVSLDFNADLLNLIIRCQYAQVTISPPINLSQV
jgi:hypothetical protein